MSVDGIWRLTIPGLDNCFFVEPRGEYFLITEVSESGDLWTASVLREFGDKRELVLSAEGDVREIFHTLLYKSAVATRERRYRHGYGLLPGEGDDQDDDSSDDEMSVVSEQNHNDGGGSSRPRSRSHSRASNVASGFDTVRKRGLPQPASGNMLGPVFSRPITRPVLSAPATQMSLTRPPNAPPNLAPNSRVHASYNVVIRVEWQRLWRETMVTTSLTRQSLCDRAVTFMRNTPAFAGVQQRGHWSYALQSVIVSGKETDLRSYLLEDFSMWASMGPLPHFKVVIETRPPSPSQALPPGGQSAGRPAAGKPLAVQKNRSEH